MSGAPDARAPVAPTCSTERSGTVGSGGVGAPCAGDVPGVGGVAVGAGQSVLAGAGMGGAQSHSPAAPTCATERSGTVGSGVVGAPVVGVVFSFPRTCGVRRGWRVCLLLLMSLQSVGLPRVRPKGRGRCRSAEVGGVVVGAGQPVLAGAWLGACGLWGAAGRWCRLSDRPRA